MPDTFALLTFSFCFMLHNVCSLKVSAPLNHTFNEDNSVSVTCMILGEVKGELEAKLKMNNQYVCKIYNKDQVQDEEKKNCAWQHEEKNKFTFTLMNPENLHKNYFSCEILRIKPFPILHFYGPQIKLFRGCNQCSPPPMSNFQIHNVTDNKTCTPVKSQAPEEIYALLFCAVILMVITVYSMTITVFYIRLRTTKAESSDTLTYVPMQRNINQRIQENTEYEDMRKVQKHGGPHRDLNHNSHLA